MVSSILLLYFIFVPICCETIIVQTPSGPIKGIKSTVTDVEDPVFKFFRIPYANPPVGHLRFRKPEPLDPWSEVLDATNQTQKICLQAIFPLLEQFYTEGYTMSEDCLLLDIFVPKRISPESKMPVMVWIHGGGFQFGSNYDCSDIAVRGDVIVVSIQYRLNIFGFFGLNNEDMRGNYGLWDQIMALKWVNTNIAFFGGDPNKVTIFGESAGGMSVHFLSLIPANEGLFQRAIAQSGTSGFPAIMDGSPQELIEEVSDKTKCPLIYNPETFIKCLQAVPGEELVKNFGFWRLSNAPYAPFMPYKPVVDGELFEEMPHELLKDPNSDVSRFFQTIDFITGVTSNEGSGVYLMFTPEEQEKMGFNISDGIPVGAFCKYLTVDFAKAYFDGRQDVAEAICAHYTIPDADADTQSMRFTDYMTDSFFKVHAVHAINSHAVNNANSRSFFYQMSRQNAKPFGPPPPKWFKGCGHGDDIMIMFKWDFKEEEVKQKDNDFANILIAYWTNFAKTGNPNGAGTSEYWPPYTPETKKYIDFNDEFTIKENMCPDAIRLWSEEIPAIMTRAKDEL